MDGYDVAQRFQGNHAGMEGGPLPHFLCHIRYALEPLDGFAKGILDENVHPSKSAYV